MRDPSLGQGWLGVVYPFQLQGILGRPLLEMPSIHWPAALLVGAAQMLGWLLIVMGALHYNFNDKRWCCFLACQTFAILPSL